MNTKMEQFPATNPNPVLSVGKDGTVLYSNEAGKPLLHEWCVVVGEKVPSCIGDFVQRVISLNSPEKMEVKVGNRVYLVAFHPLPDEEFVNIYGFDISDQKELEEKLRESEERFRSAFDNSAVPMALVDPHARISRVNDAFCRMLGFEKSEIECHSVLDFTYPDDMKTSILAHKAVINSEKPFLWIEKRYIRKDGRVIWCEVSSSPVLDSKGCPIYTVAHVQEITERKRAEAALHESETRFRTMFEAHGAPMLLIEPDSAQIIDANDAAVRFYEYSREQLRAMRIDQINQLPPEEVAAERHKAVERGKNVFVFRHRLASGDVRWVEVYSSPVTVQGRPILFSIIHDITSRKEAEAKLKETLDNLESLVKERTAELEKTYVSLKESERGLAEAQELAHVGSWERNLVTNKLHWSDEMYRIFGLKPQELEPTYDAFFSYLHPDDRDCVNDAVKKAFNGEPIAGDYRIILANGEERKVNTYAEVIFDEKNTPVRIKGTIQDITERKKIEEKLFESEEKYRNIVETANEGILITDSEAIITYVNQKIVDMVGYTQEECIGRPIWGFISEEYKPIVKLNLEKRMQGISESYELKLIRKDDSPIWIFLNAKPLFDKDGKYVGAMSMLTDITQRKEAEESLTNFEITRKKEIHHRIKNNLQVISSLLDLQAEQFRDRKNIIDSEVLKAFRESQDRVISMALIHEELHDGKGGDKVSFSPYLEKLVENLFHTYRVGNKHISLHLDLEENLFFDVDTAVPLGIIVNELVSNSLKYAFKERDRGEIRIKLHRVNGGCKSKDCKSTSYTLTVSDNGVGIPENLEIEELDSLGFQLITSLVDQLDGEFELKRNNGTEFTMRFMVTEKDNQALAPTIQQLIDN